jgi:hypothetical protein
LPRECIRKDICDLAFERRARALGRGTKDWATLALRPDNRIDWPACGCYRFKKRAGDKLELTHVSGDIGSWPEAIKLTDSVPLHMNCHDRAAKIVLEASDLPLHKYFSKDKGPNSEIVMNTKGAHFAAMAKDIAEKGKAASAVAPEGMGVPRAPVHGVSDTHRPTEALFWAAGVV